MPKPPPTPPEHLQWILGGTHAEAWTRAAEWLHANSHADAPPVARAAASDPCEDCWHAAVFATKGVVLAGYQHRDQVLTEAAESTRQAAEALPDGHKAIPGLLVATSGLLAARTAAADAPHPN